MPKTEEQCKKMREDMREKILKMSSLYFAKNGFGDTKIGDLAKHIGIGQGTIYLYFKSKEELFEEIRKRAENTDDIKKLKSLSKLPLPAKTKIDMISAEMEKKLKNDGIMDDDSEDAWRIEHIRWSRFYYVNHWSYAKERDNARRKHNLLVPYEELEYSEKAKDGIYSDVLRAEIDKLV